MIKLRVCVIITEQLVFAHKKCCLLANQMSQMAASVGMDMAKLSIYYLKNMQIIMLKNNYDRNTSLIMLASGCTKIVELLLKQDADINSIMVVTPTFVISTLHLYRCKYSGRR